MTEHPGGPPATDPWADPATPTEPGAPYAGPPPTGQPWPPGQSPYGAAGYGWPPAGYPGYPGYPGYAGYHDYPGYPAWPAWGWPPPRPRKPGQVIGAAVLAFVQSALVLIGTLYTYLFAALADVTASGGLPGTSTSRSEELATEGQVLAVVQLASVGPLIVGGILALTRRSRAAWLLLVVAFAAQVLLTLYWTLRLTGGIGEGLGLDEAGPLLGFSFFLFAGPPLVGLGLVGVGAGRRWFTAPAAG